MSHITDKLIDRRGYVGLRLKMPANEQVREVGTMLHELLQPHEDVAAALNIFNNACASRERLSEYDLANMIMKARDLLLRHYKG